MLLCGPLDMSKYTTNATVKKVKKVFHAILLGLENKHSEEERERETDNVP